jgi:hypothetical protein
MKIEVGKTYINNDGNEVKIIARLDNPITDFYGLVGIETFYGDLERVVEFGYDGAFLGYKDHGGSLKEEKK